MGRYTTRVLMLLLLFLSTCCATTISDVPSTCTYYNVDLGSCQSPECTETNSTSGYITCVGSNCSAVQVLSTTDSGSQSVRFVVCENLCPLGANLTLAFGGGSNEAIQNLTGWTDHQEEAYYETTDLLDAWVAFKSHDGSPFNCTIYYEKVSAVTSSESAETSTTEANKQTPTLPPVPHVTASKDVSMYYTAVFASNDTRWYTDTYLLESDIATMANEYILISDININATITASDVDIMVYYDTQNNDVYPYCFYLTFSIRAYDSHGRYGFTSERLEKMWDELGYEIGNQACDDSTYHWIMLALIILSFATTILIVFCVWRLILRYHSKRNRDILQYLYGHETDGEQSSPQLQSTSVSNPARHTSHINNTPYDDCDDGYSETTCPSSTSTLSGPIISNWTSLKSPVKNRTSVSAGDNPPAPEVVISIHRAPMTGTQTDLTLVDSLA